MADATSELRTTDGFLAAPIRPVWPLRTERLMLRPWVEGDFAAFLEMQRDEEVARRQYNDARHEPRNVASGRVLEKLGMRKEAHFVENEWVKGEWQSDVVHAILDREWARQ